MEDLQDLPVRRTCADEIKHLYGVKVDPLKHTHEELTELRARLLEARKLRRDFNIRANWSNLTSDELRQMHQDSFMGCD